MKTALVVGGTGPTGPFIVNGLLERGFDVTIFHSGRHEASFTAPVTHIHGDPHFPATIRASLGNAEFDVTIAQYGRLRHLATHMAGRTSHFVAIGAASGHWAQRTDPRWGPMHRPALPDADNVVLEVDPVHNKFAFRIAEAHQALMREHERGAYNATYIGYPLLYGPGQVLPTEWCIVRRILDGRRRIVLPDGGLKIKTRAYVENVAEAPLLAIDLPDRSAGKTYVVTDRESYTYREWVEAIGRYLGASLEVISMPYPLAVPSHPLYEHSPDHRIVSGTAIRQDLGYSDRYLPSEALTRTVDWLLANRPEAGGDVEARLGDPFCYSAEDELVTMWDALMCDARRRSEELDFDVQPHAHPYRHPTAPDEDWRRPTSGFNWDFSQ